MHACPLCEATTRRLLLRKNGFDIVRCGGCGLGYVHPMPTGECLAELYNEAARRGDTHTVAYKRYIGPQRPDHVALARRVVDLIAECGMRNAELGKEIGSAFRIPHSAFRIPQQRLLDVGCAAGFLLDEARRRGWEVRGVEISRDLGEYARDRLGLDLFIGELSDAGWPPASFEVVTVIGTIEHVADPRALLRECCRLLVPGGLLVVLTENLENPIACHVPRAWNGFMPPEHLYHFTPQSLSRLLGEFGATVTASVPLRSQLRAAIGGLFGGDGESNRHPKSDGRAGQASLKRWVKAALDETPDDSSPSSQVIRTAYRLADAAWSRVGVADRMIVMARTEA
jgi:2-polyprenyl-3-methyl-5-hydroxy-6-metoxy-1,4-benzoquinol methylase